MDLNEVAAQFLKELNRVGRLNADDFQVTVHLEWTGGKQGRLVWHLCVQEKIDKHQFLAAAGPMLIDVFHDALTKIEEACVAWDYRYR